MGRGAATFYPECAMKLPTQLAFALAVTVSAVTMPGGAHAQQTDKPFDFRPLLPPLVPVPPNSQVTSGSVGGTQNPYTTAPLQSPTQGPSQSAPGMRLTVPSR
jgi:hypothetical protein